MFKIFIKSNQFSRPLPKINTKEWEEMLKIGNSDKFDLIDD